MYKRGVEMKQEILKYIAACEQNICNYMLIEDADDRQRAVDAAYAMKADFEELLKEFA
jgi:hypothetical protein